MAKRKRFELDKLQQETLSLFSSSPLRGSFYWTGGTALSFFHLQHRKSEDIDLFSSHPFSHEIILEFINSLRKKTNLSGVEEKRIYSRYEFFLHNDSTLRLEFVHYDFPALGKKKKWKGIFVDSLTDMAANKTMAMLDRHDPKDAFDVYFLIHEKKFSAVKLVSLVKKKFGITFPISVFLDRALLSAQALKNIKPLLLQPDKIIDAVIEYFEKESAKELRKRLSD
ncbi:MAG: nucleotidyl transferase AbiEii/AbiGii toxin family protein [Bacteroidetes bacterium]|nr:nucleotidyl transferase AbiEii/AbiGii toxin family protein [Bacteroidota bacterium]